MPTPDHQGGLDMAALAQKPELLTYTLAKSSLRHYVPVVTYEPPPVAHHDLLIEALDRVATGEIKRLMVFMPPGGAKSTYASMIFPSYYMGKNPRKNVIGVSHTLELAERFSRKVRNFVSSPEYEDVFGFGLSATSHAAGRWENERGGEYFAVGIGGGVTGRRGDLGVIDDPMKSREDADSLTYRNRLWEWFKADFRTRIKPGGAIVLIQTRWHEDDLAGRILPEGWDGKSGKVTARDGEVWEVLCITALCDNEEMDPLVRKLGESYWESFFTKEALEQERHSQGERNWSALYQQKPTPDTGITFQREWIRWYEEAPKNMSIYGSSDYAVSDNSGDWTVHLIVGIDSEDNIFLLDMWRDRKTSAVWVDSFIDLVLKWKPVKWAEESGQITKSMGPYISKKQREKKAWCWRKQFPSHKDKTARCQSISGRMSEGMVHFPRNEGWAQDMISELMIFPAGKNDDMVDAFSLIGRMLDEMGRPRIPKGDKEIAFNHEDFKWPLEMTFDELRESVTKKRVSGEVRYL
jgi:predicted phage terminase large subunit-like protein